MQAADPTLLVFGLDARIVAIVVSLTALAGSVISLMFSWQARRFSERETAHGVYRKYLELAIQNPRFATEDISLGTFEGEERTKYRLFVAMLLIACEEILERDPGAEWQKTISRQLKRHTAYLGQMEPDARQQYDCRVRKMVSVLLDREW
jgi:hypothetical protein